MAEVSDGYEYGHRLSLTEILGELTRKELESLCRQHEITGFSRLNKIELIKKISQYILSMPVIYNYFICMNDSEIEYVRMARDTDGIVEDAEPEAFSYLIIGGYAGFNQNLDFGIPWEVLELFDRFDDEDFEEKRQRICLIGNYSHIANYLYGVTPPMTVVKMFNRNEKKKTDWAEVVHVYDTIQKYRCDFIYRDNYFIDTAFSKGYEDLLRLQGNIPYYLPGREQVEEWCQVGFPAVTSYLMELYKYMVEQLWTDEDTAADVCFMMENTLHVGCCIGSVMNQLKNIGVYGRTRRQRREFQALLENLLNHSRMIIYRGHTPLEAARLRAGK